MTIAQSAYSMKDSPFRGHLEMTMETVYTYEWHDIVSIGDNRSLTQRNETQIQSMRNKAPELLDGDPFIRILGLEY